MLESLKQEINKTYTENGAVAHSTTGSDCLDFFAAAGAIRWESESAIIDRFVRAYIEDRDAALKLLFFTRDIRGGLGERKVFRTILRWLAVYEPESVRKNISFVAEFGRFDDLLVLLDTPCEDAMLALIRRQFEEDMKSLSEGGAVSLLGKWLPSVNASNKETVRTAKRIARALGMKDVQYRRSLSALRARISILENSLREKDYSFDYEKQPSRAMFKYRAAFHRNDGERYMSFLNKVHSGEAKQHADNVSPYELVEPYLGGDWWTSTHWIHRISPQEKESLNATWSSLPDFGGEENALAVVDTSGSMYCGGNPKPASVALSLGLYFAERNKGCFHNTFIEFSERPQLIEIKGDTFVDRLLYAMTFNEIANTNLEAVFDLILDAAVKNDLPQEELPARLILISDMEFDRCVWNASETMFGNAKKRFEEKGYRLPEIVFWNVASRHGHQPVTMNEQGVALVSGATPRLFEMVAGGNLSPYTFMMEVLKNQRYACISA